MRHFVGCFFVVGGFVHSTPDVRFTHNNLNMTNDNFAFLLEFVETEPIARFPRTPYIAEVRSSFPITFFVWCTLHAVERKWEDKRKR